MDNLTRQMIRKVQTYADARGMKPETVLRNAVSYGSPVWQRWLNGEQTLTGKSADKITAYMRKNPPPKSGDQTGAFKSTRAATK